MTVLHNYHSACTKRHVHNEECRECSYVYVLPASDSLHDVK